MLAWWTGITLRWILKILVSKHCKWENSIKLSWWCYANAAKCIYGNYSAVHICTKKYLDKLNELKIGFNHPQFIY